MCSGSEFRGLTGAMTQPSYNRTVSKDSSMSRSLGDSLRVTNLRNGVGRGQLLGCPNEGRSSRSLCRRDQAALEGMKPNPGGDSRDRKSFTSPGQKGIPK